MYEGEDIVVYGRPGCPDCERAVGLFQQFRVIYQFVNTEEEPDAKERAREINLQLGREPRVPTIVFPPQAIPPDGRILTEPIDSELLASVAVLTPAYRQSLTK